MSEHAMNFESVSQRVLFAYKTAYSDFTPIPDESADADSQRALHDLLGELLDRLFHAPSLLGLPEDTDRAYPWALCNNQIPELNTIYLSVFKTLYEFYRFLHASAVHGVLSDRSLRVARETLKAAKAAYKPAYAAALGAVGITASAERTAVTLSHADGQTLFAAWKLLGSRCQWALDEYRRFPNMNDYHNLFCFAACNFSGSLDYLLDRFDGLFCQTGLLPELRSKCEAEDYVCTCGVQLSPTDFIFRVQLARRTGGFLLTYNPRKEWPAGFGTLNGIGEKAMLEDFERLDDDMKDHFLRICRPCSGCLGCTKNGKNRPFTVTVSHGGSEYRLCPMFPTHTWESVDRPLIDRLMKYHDLQDKYAQ